MLKYINLLYFITSFAIGILFVYINELDPRIIRVYPTPETMDALLYKDNLGTCFEMNKKEINCPTDSSKIHSIPLQ